MPTKDTFTATEAAMEVAQIMGALMAVLSADARLRPLLADVLDTVEPHGQTGGRVVRAVRDLCEELRVDLIAKLAAAENAGGGTQ